MGCSNFHRENDGNKIDPDQESSDFEDIEIDEDSEMWSEDEEPQPQTENDVTFELLCSHPEICCRLFPIRSVEVLLENGYGLMTPFLKDNSTEDPAVVNILRHILWEAPSCDAIISILDKISLKCAGVNPYHCHLIFRTETELIEETLVKFGLDYCCDVDEETQVRFFSMMFNRGTSLFTPAIKEVTCKNGEITENFGDGKTNVELIFDEFCMEFFYRIIVTNLFLHSRPFCIEPPTAGVCQRLRQSIQVKFDEIEAEMRQFGFSSWKQREGFIWFMNRLTI